MATATFGDSEATRVIAAIEERVRRRTKNGALMHTTWGKVASTDASGASVFLYDEIQNQLVASEGFRIPKGYTVAVNDIVKVWIDSSNGERWLDPSTCTFTTVEDGFLTIQAVASEVNEGGELILEGAGANPDWKLDVYQTGFRVHSAGTAHVLVNSTRTNLFGTLTLGSAEDTNLYRSLANVLKTDDTFQAVGGVKVTSPSNVDGQNFEAFRSQLPNNGYVGLAQYISAEANPVFRVTGTGAMEWGAGGASAIDTNLYRSGANQLVTDDALRVAGVLSIGASGAGQSADGVNISGGSIEMRSANPFIDFKISDIDFGARIIYDFSVSDALEFSGATTYRFDNVVVFGGDISLGARQMTGDAPVVRVYTTTGANTWTKPANFSHIVVEIVGAGGGGGGVAASGAGEQGSGGNGGGGGYSRKLFTAANLSGAASFTATVGTGGTLGAAGANAGGTGGTSSFAGTGITTVSGSGGSGGVGSTPSNTTATWGGGSGGAASGGDINVTGSDGDSGRTLVGALNQPGMGGASLLSTNQRQAFTGAGSTGAAYGGGGTGGTVPASTAARAGGAGANGVVIVTEYYFA